MHRPTPYIFFPVALIFLAVHLLALRTDLYWYLGWLDIAMHIVGGFLIVYGASMLGLLGSGRLRMGGVQIAALLLFTVIAWEVFEYYFGIAGTHPSYLVDTALDIVSGVVGGVIGYLVIKRTA